MLRPIATRPVLVVLALTVALSIAGCTGSPSASPTGDATLGPLTGAPTAEPVSPSGSSLPTCDDIAAAALGLVDGLVLDTATSAAQEAQEEYEQRVCVYRTSDGSSALGITIAAILFQQSELDGYATRPNSISDQRLATRSAVLQTFEEGDGDDGFLDSPLYLIDVDWSITIQGAPAEGSSVSTVFPQLTVPTATDAAFAVRDVVG